MKAERLLNQIGEIDERYIAEAAPAAKKTARPRWINWAAAAACLCLAGIGIFAAIRYGRPANQIGVSFPAASFAPYRVVLLRDPDGDEQWDPAHVRLIAADQGLCLPGSQNSPAGAGEVAVYVAPIKAAAEGSGEMSVDEAKEYAYLDPDSASDELKEKILEARRIIIFHSRWVADGYSGKIEDLKTGEVESLPTFSELFPGWELPVYDTAKEQFTEDGLGADCLYGLELTVIRAEDAFLLCTCREAMYPFDADQTINVYPPEGVSMQTLGLAVGDTVFVSYFGKDCSRSRGTIRAEAIEAR